MATEVQHLQLADQPSDSPTGSGNGDSQAASIASITAFAIRPVIRRKLHVSLDANDTSSQNQDGLELVSDVQAILISTIHSGKQEIRDLEGYAATVASNACYQYFRSKFPVRTQQTNKLRYLLTHHDPFLLWKAIDGRWICGYSEWRNFERPVTFPTLSLDESECEPANIKTLNPRAELIGIIESVFDQTCKPILFDDLVSHIMNVLGIADVILVGERYENNDRRWDEIIADPTPDAGSEIESHERLRHLWKGILSLPVPDRVALLLNLRCKDGEGLISVFPLTGTASIKTLASALGFLPLEFAAIWNSLPWEDRQIAAHLGLTRQQVINLRQTARARLGRFQREYS